MRPYMLASFLIINSCFYNDPKNSQLGRITSFAKAVESQYIVSPPSFYNFITRLLQSCYV
jgi:hypothetical protein